MSNPIYQAAQAALARGWSVMPVSRTAGKVPAVKWKQYQSERPAPDELKAWFAGKPDTNLGIITGALSGLFIVDTDTVEAVEWMEAQGVPVGPIAQGSAPFKRHYYFSWPDFTVKNSVKQIHPGADVRGEGGYAVLPPSVHKNGAVYEWLVSPDEVDVPTAPDWLLAIPELQKTEFVPSEPVVPLVDLNGSGEVMQKYAHAALEAELSLVAHAPDGQKHAQLFKSVAKVAEFIPHGLLSEGEIRGLFFHAVAPRAEDKRGALKTIEDAISKGQQSPRRLPERQQAPRVVLRGRQARAYVDGATEEEAAQMDAEEGDPDDWRTGPYGISDGRIVHIFERSVKGEQTTVVQTVANLTAYIAREVTTEHGDRAFVIRGQGVLGRHFEFEINAEGLADEKRLKAALIAAAGAKSTIMSGMAKHLYPAIDILTGHIEQSTRYDRTGWAVTPDGPVFLMPGREEKLPEYSAIHLQGNMPYSIREGANLANGQKALRHLLRSQSTPLLCVELAAMLQAPLSLPAGWRNERYGCFITGRTNSFKTSTTQVMQCLYGADFIDDRNLLRWDGTTNAIMKMAVLAYDMPLLIDNYKPNVGKDAAGRCIALIQSIVEGSEKARMNRDRSLSDREAIYAWPFITGEDVPETDAASLARILVLRLPQMDAINPELTQAQA
ncbi:MAG: bifunctional DNA primase/polymerase, partial [Armatimonadetes bacterium]|nr:bifunctional DNA primase/polymerase [Armatimonadota bacterium]